MFNGVMFGFLKMADYSPYRQVYSPVQRSLGAHPDRCRRTRNIPASIAFMSFGMRLQWKKIRRLIVPRKFIGTQIFRLLIRVFLLNR
jgi:hypothetical protein